MVWKWPEALETGPGGLIELVLHAVWWGVGDMGGSDTGHTGREV